MLLKKLSLEKKNEIGRYYAGFGSMSLVIAILLGRFLNFALADFIIGILYGISVALNIAGLYLLGCSFRNSTSTKSENTIGKNI